MRLPGQVQGIIEHLRSAAGKKDIDPDIVKSTHRAMISALIERELRIYKAMVEIA